MNATRGAARRGAGRAGLVALAGRVGRTALAGLAWLAVLSAAGCGYSFSGSSLPSHLKTIAIPVFENQSLDPTIADEVTSGVLDQFLEDNRLKVAREARADC